jgi:hypothetical protein
VTAQKEGVWRLVQFVVYKIERQVLDINSTAMRQQLENATAASEVVRIIIKEKLAVSCVNVKNEIERPK